MKTEGRLRNDSGTFKKKKDAVAEHDKMRTLVREKRFLDVAVEYNTKLKELLDKYEENFRHQKLSKSRSHIRLLIVSVGWAGFKKE